MHSRGTMQGVGAGIGPFVRLAVVAIAAITVSCSTGDGSASDESEVSYRPAQVLDLEGTALGSVAFPVSCSDPAAEHVRRGLALLHHMTYTEAETSFRTATEVDPSCAPAYWGTAMSYVHPLWPDEPPPEAFDRGWALLQDARQKGAATGREEAYVAALEAYYRDGASKTEPQRLAAYADAWEGVASAYPDDPEATLFRALTMIATSGGEGGLERRERAGDLAEEVMQRIEDHPGAHHYVIHAFDVPRLAGRALSTAHSYGNVAPENAHALHMTSHIFTRVGSWDESIDYNVRSAAAALKQPINGSTSHHHLHAVDYLAYAHLQRAEDDLARDVARHLGTLDGPVMNHAASAYAFAAVPARIALETQSWTEAAEVAVRWPSTIPWDAYPHLEAIPHFARALGAAHIGDFASAEAAADRLAELREAAAAMPSAYDWGIQVHIQELGARAWTALRMGYEERAVRLMQDAADLESTTEKNPVTPGEALPARELLGDMLLELGRFDEARAAYETALERSPNRFNSLYGAGRAAEASGDMETAAEFYGKLVEVVPEGASGRTRLEYARAALRQ